MRMAEAQSVALQILHEIQDVLDQVDGEEVERLVDELLAAEKVFFFGVGRVFLSLECLAKRLGHLGVDCQVVGSINEKPATPRDLLLIASGSGESKLPVEIARIAKSKGARLGIITSAPSSTLKSMADFAVRLPVPDQKQCRGRGAVHPTHERPLRPEPAHLWRHGCHPRPTP